MSDTLYPHLDALQTALETALGALRPSVPLFVHADRSAILAQITPAAHLLPGKIHVGDMIRSGRTVSSIAMASEWEVVILVRDPADQRDMVEPLITLGELMAVVLTTLGQGPTLRGGPLTLLEIPATKVWSGGLVSGSIPFRLGWAFSVSP